MENTNFLQDLERVAQVRKQIAHLLTQISAILNTAENQGEHLSGKLGLERDITDLNTASQVLQDGRFRLLVLGDMKRGKSTFLNALIGENLLPIDVNPCTALLTILRYGKSKKVTVYFNDQTPPEELEFTTFKQRYTIDPREAKRLEKEKNLAFPTVSHAVVEYPLALLEKGVEIIDSPGLNDTEARNDLSLGYIANCHAILFVLRATQPCTLGERRYLENYIKDRGLTVFFLINAWDQIRESLIDPDDQEELAEAAGRLRQVFRSNLEDYCQTGGFNLYSERVFEISAIQALRCRVKNRNESLTGTGFPEFIQALSTYLTQERAIGELRPGLAIARQVNDHIHQAIDRRIPLLEQSLNELKQRIQSVEPEFEKLNGIRDKFQQEIREVRDLKARKIANSFHDYILNLGNTFETDFLQYQPNLDFLRFLTPQGRKEFETGLQKAFEQYVNDKLATWTVTAQQEMDAAFTQLSRSAAQYGASYSQVTDNITEKLTGQPLPTFNTQSSEDNSPAWAKWAMGLFSLARGNIAGVAMAGVGFDWKNILLNLITVFSLSAIISAVTGIVLGPLYLALLGMGVGVLQADQARKELVKATKKELVKHLPQIAQQQWYSVYDAIKQCFDIYEGEVTQRMNDDIQSRQAELDNLIQQKASHEINQNSELTRLHTLAEEINNKTQEIETIYRNFQKSL